jgi:hypothetical protein
MSLSSAVPSRFADIVSTIEQWGDLTNMTMAEAIGRLTAFKQNHHRRDHGVNYEQLMLVT